MGKGPAIYDINTLLQAGEITLEEAKNFPRKNVITKAIQPHGKKRFKAEVQHLTDIKSGDYIFLCCDGVLEQLTNERLVEILSMTCSDKEKLALLESESTDKTKDNYTAYLIPIDKVSGVSSIEQKDEIETVVVETASPSSQNIGITTTPVKPHANSVSKTPLKATKNMYYALAITGVILLLIMFCLGRCSSKDSKESESKKTKMEQLFHVSICFKVV